MAHINNPNTRQAEAGGLPQVTPDQTELRSEALFQINEVGVHVLHQ